MCALIGLFPDCLGRDLPGRHHPVDALRRAPRARDRDAQGRPRAWLTMIALLAINHLPFIGMLVVLAVARARHPLAGWLRARSGHLPCRLLGEPERRSISAHVFYTVALAGGADRRGDRRFCRPSLYIDGLVILDCSSRPRPTSRSARWCDSIAPPSPQRWSELGSLPGPDSGAGPGAGNMALSSSSAASSRRHVRACRLLLELLDGAWPDDRTGDTRLPEQPCKADGRTGAHRARAERLGSARCCRGARRGASG